MFISFLFVFMFLSELNNIFSIPIRFLNDDYNKIINFNDFIKTHLGTRYKNKVFNDIFNYNYENTLFGQSVLTKLSYCYYNIPNNANIKNLICGLRYYSVINIKLPAI